MSNRAWNGIIGHRRAMEPLWRALASDHLHHAFLFVGPKGVGKRLVGQRLAMALTCEQQVRPCGQCAVCKLVSANNHPDVIIVEPDPKKAAAKISVSAIREVIRKTGFHRYSAARRVIIIDAAEDMSEGAANALLKTLEEPPAGTHFVLISHNPTALLPTIRSRCQQVRFGALPTGDLQAWLEERDVKDALRAATVAQGCPGAALQLASGALAERSEFRDELVGVLHRPLRERYDWTAKLCSGDRKKWLKKVELYVEVVQDLLRDVVVMGSGARLDLLNSDRPDLVSLWTSRLYPDGVVVCSRAVDDLRKDLELNVSGKTALDAFVLALAHALGKGGRS